MSPKKGMYRHYNCRDSFTVNRQGVRLITFPAIIRQLLFKQNVFKQNVFWSVQQKVHFSLKVKKSNKRIWDAGFFSKHRNNSKQRNNQARRLVPLHRDTETATGCDQPITSRSRLGGNGANLPKGLQSATDPTTLSSPTDAGVP